MPLELNTIRMQYEEQIYWQQSMLEYEALVQYGPEILSSIASVSKPFWEKSMKEDNFKTKWNEARYHQIARF